MLQIFRVAAVLFLCKLAITWAVRTPPIVPAGGPRSEFSAERALRHIEKIAAQPHPTGSVAHDAARDYVLGEIRKLGLTPEVQSTTGVGTKYPVAGHVQNILVRVPGTQPGGLAVLLAAHYDGVSAGPAAGDDAAGSAALLETLRAIRAGPALTHDVIFLFTDSEENGLLGAAAFVREHAWARDAGVILNFEARGISGPSLMFETGRGNRDVARALRRTGWGRGTSLSTAVYRRLPNDTDLSEFVQLDRPAMNFAFIGDVARYHSSEDDVAHLDRGSVQHHGVQALALARAFGNDTLPRPVTGDAVFFFVPGLGTIVYPEAAALPIAIVALVLVVVGTIRRRKVDPEKWVVSVAIGFGAALVALCLGLGIGGWLGGAFVGFHRAIGSGDPRWSETYAFAVAISVLALTIAAFRVGVRFASAVGLEAGALLLWSGLSVVVAILLPGASFLFTWPLVFAAIALLTSPNESSTGGLLNWLATAIVVTIVAPTAYLMVVFALGLDGTGGALLGVLVAMAATLARPVLVRPYDRWWPLAVGPAMALSAIVYAASFVRTNSEHRVGASLALVIDADSVRAFATGTATGPVGAGWVESAAKANRNAEELPAWVRRLNGGLPGTLAERFTSPIRPPRVTVLKDSAIGGQRILLARIQPGERNTLGISLELDSGSVVSAAVDGRAIDRSRYRRASSRWRLDFVAPPDSGFTLALTLEGTERPRLAVTARQAGLAAWPVAMIQRTDDLFHVQNDDMTIVRATAGLEAPSKPHLLTKQSPR